MSPSCDYGVVVVDLHQMNVRLSAELDAQKADIARRNEAVQLDLSKAEPALIEAQESVKLIKRTQLDELRSVGYVCVGVGFGDLSNGLIDAVCGSQDAGGTACHR